MKYFKKIISSFMLAICIFGASITVSAEEINKSINSNEINQAESAINNFSDMMEDTEVYSVNVSDKNNDWNMEGLESFDMSKAYKCYHIDGLIIDDYKRTKNFASLISDDYRVFVPTYDKVITLYPDDNGKLKVIGYVNAADENNLIEETEKVKAQINEEISEIVYANSFLYNLKLIYITTVENEYVVPYFMGMSVEEIGDRIENGKLYSPDEFIQAMDNTFDIEHMDPYSQGGGVPLKLVEDNHNSQEINSVNDSASVNANNNENNMLIIYSISVGIVLAAIFAGTFIYKKIKTSK